MAELAREQPAARPVTPAPAPVAQADPLLKELVEGGVPATKPAPAPAAPMPRSAEQVDRGVLDSLLGDGEKDKR